MSHRESESLQAPHIPRSTQARRALRFGLISDIQYADIDDAKSFSGYEHRSYRDSAGHAAEALRHWRTLETQPLFIAQLGDLIDGQNAGEYGQGLTLKTPQSERALARALEAWGDCAIPTYHAIGNHELYNFGYPELIERFNCARGIHRIYDIEREEFYFSWRPAQGWRIVMLNAYELSVIRPRSPKLFERAEAILHTHNPNYGRTPPYDYFEGLTPEHMRYVPFNGGFGEAQLTWLEEELDGARAVGERVIVMSHLPIYAPVASMRNIAFDADQARELIGASGVVAAYLSGHSHAGGLARDEFKVHHLIAQAPLTHGYCAATVDVYADRIEVIGLGAHRSYTLELCSS